VTEAEILRLALLGYEAERRRLEGMVAEIQSRLGERVSDAGDPAGVESPGEALDGAAGGDGTGEGDG
jgi:hypothetical protein